ncbi:MAG TPA: hypothetical protein VFK80_00220 [Limnochordia bacterium]|nr:hypothetical protein [Limnochordia bacterium]
MADKTRTAEAALGQVDFDHTLQVGPYTVGYLSIRRSESKKLRAAEDLDASTQFFFDAIKRRCAEGEGPADIEAFEDEVGEDDLGAFLAWISGADPDVVRARYRQGDKTDPKEAAGKKSGS